VDLKYVFNLLNALKELSAVAADAGIVKINLISLVISENKVFFALKNSFPKILIISEIVVVACRYYRWQHKKLCMKLIYIKILIHII